MKIGDSIDLSNGLVILKGKLNEPPNIKEAVAGACTVAGFGDKPAALSKASGKCAPAGDEIVIKLEKAQLCPSDAAGAVLNEADELIGILKPISACGETGVAMKTNEAKDKAVSGGGGDDEGEIQDDETTITPAIGRTSSVTASTIVISFVKIMVVLYRKCTMFEFLF